MDTKRPGSAVVIQVTIPHTNYALVQWVVAEHKKELVAVLQKIEGEETRIYVRFVLDDPELLLHPHLAVAITFEHCALSGEQMKTATNDLEEFFKTRRLDRVPGAQTCGVFYQIGTPREWVSHAISLV